MKLEHLREKARQAFYGVSFSPEKRGDRTIEDYSSILEDDLKRLGENSGNYEQKFINKFEKWLSAKSNCMSTMITGASNFPVRRNQKALDVERRRFEDFMSWRDRYFKAVDRVPTPSPEEAIREAEKELFEAQQLQELMKAVNKAFRKKGLTDEDKSKITANLGVTPDIARRKFMDSAGFPRFCLTNNNAKIKRLIDKVKINEARILVKENFEDIKFDGGYITIEDDRVVIKHDEKPPKEVIQNIKSRGFRWSPKMVAWVRKHTAQALIDAKSLVLN